MNRDILKLVSFISVMIQLALVALATNPVYHKDFLSAVKSWPRSVYSPMTVLSEIEPQLRASLMTDDLKDVIYSFSFLFFLMMCFLFMVC